MARKAAGNSRNRDFRARLDIRKRKIRPRRKQTTDISADERSSAFLGIINRKKLASFTESVVKYSALAAYTVGCIQFGPDTTSHGKKYVRGSVKKRICHYVVTTLLFVSVVHKLTVSIVKFNEPGRPSVETLMCMSLFMIQFVGFAMSLSLVFSWEKSIELLNTWDRLVACIDETGERTPYDDASASLKLIFCMQIAVGCGAGNAIVSLLFSNLPVCFYPMCQAAGLIPDIGLSPFVWQLAFFPLELILGVMAMCNGNLGGIVLMGSTAVQKVFLAAMKDMNLSDLATRRKTERLYACLQLYHHAQCSWWNWTLPGTYVSLSSTVILAMYVGLRHAELPWYLYWVFWFAGVGVLLQMFGTGYDVICAKEDSEEIVERLQSPANAALVTLPLEERRKILKGSKAMAGLQFDIAHLAQYSWAVPLGAWDEILNQLLFLLSL